MNFGIPGKHTTNQRRRRATPPRGLLRQSCDFFCVCLGYTTTQKGLEPEIFGAATLLSAFQSGWKAAERGENVKTTTEETQQWH